MYLPETMKSKLLTEVNYLQEPTGEFPCVVVGAADDNQFSDPCASQTRHHPDDITMVLIAAHEQYSLANDTAVIAQIWPKLLKAFGFFKTYYDTAPWSVPYTTHETYDAVKESSTVTGEGNLGSSLYNAVNYLLGLHIIRELAGSQGDSTTEVESQAMIERVRQSIQLNFWQPVAGFYIGDTLQANTYELENNGFPYHSSDDLHGQVLAYRLGFGDLLPRRQMQLHQQYVLRDLSTEFGLQFDDYSKQNWCDVL
jgi:glycogen debranching enzyme